MKTYPLIIDGRTVEGASSRDVVDPATGAPFARAATGSAAQLDAAIDAARRAFPAWAALGFQARRGRLLALADLLETEAQGLARLLTREQGKPLPQAEFEVGAAVRALRWSADFAHEERAIPSRAADIRVRRKPLGVIGCITPWNFPLLLAINKIAPALITGNVVVLKPAPTTPLTSLELGRLATGVLPPGVLNVLADDNDLGPLLTAHPGVDKVSFTGSTATGRRIMQSAAVGLKRITLELGGNDAAIVLADADVDRTVAGLVATAYLNAGQVCVAPKRIFVSDKIYEQFAVRFAEAAAGLRIGPGMEPGVAVGPLQNAAQFEKVREILREAVAVGRVMTGGKVVNGPGFFIEPTVVCDVAEGVRLVDEEQFGPVVPLIRFDDETEVLRRANASSQGLGGSVWSRDVARATELAARLECGTAWVNQHLALGPDIPFAGAKQSGIGVESGLESFDEFTQLQVVNVARAAP